MAHPLSLFSPPRLTLEPSLFADLPSSFLPVSTLPHPLSAHPLCVSFFAVPILDLPNLSFSCTTNNPALYYKGMSPNCHRNHTPQVSQIYFRIASDKRKQLSNSCLLICHTQCPWNVSPESYPWQGPPQIRTFPMAFFENTLDSSCDIALTDCLSNC